MHSTLTCFFPANKMCEVQGNSQQSTGATQNATDALALVLAAITSSQTELQQIREEMRQSQEDTAVKLAQMRKDRPFQFQKQGHEEQYHFNQSVEGKFAEAEAQLQKAERLLGDGPAKAAVEKAKTALKEGEELVAHWQKLIKVADRSEFGWAVVAEYEADALATDADDERRLERAEKAAERKMAAKRKKLATGSQAKKLASGQPQ